MTPQLAALSTGTIVLFILLIIRDIIRKGIALWKAGRNKQLPRFICILIFNTVGILPIIYIAFFQKKK
jgi:hypothetical protein